MAMHLANEAQLLADARSGNHDAFGSLISSCYRSTFQMALGITRNHEDAEDALQEAMIKAYRNLDQFRGNSKFYTWFFRIAANEAVMSIRKRHLGRDVTLDDMDEFEASMQASNRNNWRIHPEERCLQLEFSALLDKALSKLSPRLGKAFYLRAVEELSFSEAAAALNLSCDGVKTRVSRARSRLRKKLSGLLHPVSGGKRKPNSAMLLPSVTRKADPRFAIQ
jgi:RNA polymerase sigma-70 factor (ECF subfamily)